MWYDIAYNKKITFITIVVFVVIIFNVFNIGKLNITYAKEVSSDEKIEEEFSDNIDKILGDVDSTELDDFLINDFNLEFLSVNSFKDLAVKILSGSYFEEYVSLFDGIVSTFKSGFKELFLLFLVVFAIVVLFEIFKNFCTDKYQDLKSVVKIIISSIIILFLLQLFRELSVIIYDSIESVFLFSKVLFPILLGLILISGSVGTYSIYSSMSLYFINAGSYLFTYILYPLSISIFVLTVFSGIMSNKKLLKVNDILKSAFKYLIIIFFTIFGLFSMVNLISSGMKDGVSLRLTKYAIKNYIPLVGGYVSQGFDFVHSCSIIIKNVFGLCGIIVLAFMVLKPMIVYFVYLFMFKLLAVLVSFLGNDFYSDLFSGVSKSMSYFIVVLVGLFFIIFVFIYLLVISVSVI